MGAGLTRTLERVLPESGQGSVWLTNSRGPTLRKFFGAYSNPDLWAVYRRLKKIDSDGDGWLTYEDMQKLLALPDVNLLFLWELFSHQNELIQGRELLTAVCVFSSAGLKDKGKFLMTLFDASHTGSCTGAEVAQVCVAALGVLGRCTGAVVKPKEVASALRDELPGLLPEYREALRRRGDKVDAEKSFQQERVISQAELEKLLPTVQSAYEELPIAGSPPVGAVPPAPADWGTSSTPPPMEHGWPGAGTTVTGGGETPGGPAGGGTAAVRALAASRQGSTARLNTLLHEAQDMVTTIEEDKAMEEAAQRVAQREADAAQAREEAAAAKLVLSSAKATLIIHGHDLAEVEKDLASFRYIFVKGVSSALDIPSGCVEVLDIVQGSIRVFFKLHPACRRGDFREGAELLLALEEQLGSASSMLRRGKFQEYAASAELLREGSEASTLPRTVRLRCDTEVQATDWECTLKEVLGMLDDEQKQYHAAESGLQAIHEEVAEVDAAIARLQLGPQERLLSDDIMGTFAEDFEF